MSIKTPRREPSRISVSATEAKNEFGRLLDSVLQGAEVVITRHDAPRAILLSMDAFKALSAAGERQLDSLSEEFDELLASQQSPKAKAGLKVAFAASPKQLGKAALAAARVRGR